MCFYPFGTSMVSLLSASTLPMTNTRISFDQEIHNKIILWTLHMLQLLPFPCVSLLVATPWEMAKILLDGDLLYILHPQSQSTRQVVALPRCPFHAKSIAHYPLYQISTQRRSAAAAATTLWEHSMGVAISQPQTLCGRDIRGWAPLEAESKFTEHSDRRVWISRVLVVALRLLLLRKGTWVCCNNSQRRSLP